MTDSEIAGDVFVLPAAFAQARLWFIDELTPGRSTYNIPVALKLIGTLDVAALREAIDGLVARQDALRTTFAVEDGDLMQVVHPPAAVPLEVRDFVADAAPRDAAMTALALEANTPFDLRRGPLIRFSLFRVGPTEHMFTAVVHHIVADGWSVNLMLRELAEGYSASREQRPVSLAPLGVQYADFAIWQREQLAGDSLRHLEAYWSDRLRGPLPALELPFRAARTGMREGRPAQRVQFRVPDATARRITELARVERATDFMMYLAAFQLLLGRYAAHDDVVVGTPVSGRSSPELEPVVGFFVNTLALRTDLSGDPTFRALLGRVREMSLGAFANDALPFERIVDIVKPARDMGRTPVFQAVFSMNNLDAAAVADDAAGGPAFSDLRIERIATMLEEAKFDLQLTLSSGASSCHGSIQYDAGLLDAAVVRRLAGHFLTLLDAIVANPDAPISTLAIADPAETQLVLRAWNDTASSYPRDATVHELVFRQAAERPDAIAVLAGTESVSYAALVARSHALALVLDREGIRPGQLVALCMERSIDMLVAMLAILESGCAYVPLDPQYPVERLRLMLADATAPVVLLHPATSDVLEPVLREAGSHAALLPRPLIVHTDADVRTAAPPPGLGRRATATDAAYVMFTSGSTGRPKGVRVSHRAIVRLVRDTNYADLDADQVLLAFAPASFDAATFEIWGALANGGRLVLAPPGLLDFSELTALIERHRITTLWLTSALFQQVVDTGLHRLQGVRQLLAGGDVLSVPHVRRVLEALPQCRLINGYGPTENTTFTCCFTIPHDWPADRAIPIGRPVANTQAYILDAAGNPAPIGVPGELYAGGDGVALGYVNDDALTAARFLPDPFSPIPGARMYRTGDRVRWGEDGVIDFLGRIDAQLKIRGFRVEPGEIETALLAHPGVRAAAVMPIVAPGGDKQLAAYYEVQGGHVGAAELRGFLKATLPPYMIPGHFVEMARLPIGMTGKIDRAALPPPGLTTDNGKEHVAPRTAEEQEIVRLWESLLPTQSIGVHDDFFDLGGHSLLAMRMIAQIEQRYDRRLPLRALLEHPTIAEIAAVLTGKPEDHDLPGATVLQRGGAGTPLAFVHGDLMGGGRYCRTLAGLLGDAPLIVLATMRPGTPPTIEAMAEQHVASLRAVQPHGPYRVGGFCQGGLVAYEMARLLVASGEKVEAVILIDAVCRNVRFLALQPIIERLSRGGTAEETHHRRIAAYLRLHYYARRIRELRRQKLGEQLRFVTTRIVARLTRRAAMPVDPAGVRIAATPANPVAAAEEAARVAQFVFTRNSQRGYMPGRYDGRVDLVLASDFVGGRKWVARGGGWERMVTDLRQYELPNGHEHLILPDSLGALAALIRACLDEATGAG